MTEETTPVFVMGDGTVLYGVEQHKAHMEAAMVKIITIMGEEMQRQVAAETARCADAVREMLKWPYELDETTIPTIAKWLIREIEK